LISQLPPWRRFRRPDFGHLEIRRTLVDQEAFAEAWTVPVKLELDADTEPPEYACNESERDRLHLIGKASDVKSVKVASEILSKYAEFYELKVPGTDRISNMTISLDGDRLMAGAAVFGNLKFITDDAGVVTHLILQMVEGDLKAVRK
jgi:hypothetical protein